jgi:hypothetical protein
LICSYGGIRFNNKKATQRQVDKVWKVLWETLKHTSIVKEDEDQEAAEKETFYTPPNSSS